MKNLLLLLILMFCNTAIYSQYNHQDYRKKQRQAMISEINPVFAKIQTQTKEGWKEEVILKTDSTRISNIEKFTEGYFLYDTEIIRIDTTYTYWEKKSCFGKVGCCCFSNNPEDCLFWALVKKEIDTTETINIYRPVDEYNPINSENDKAENPNINLTTAFPNPFQDKLTIQSNENITNISITDISGKIVFQQNANQNELVLDLQHLAKGNYLLSVETVTGSRVIKILK